MKFNVRVPDKQPTSYSMFFSKEELINILEAHIIANGLRIPNGRDVERFLHGLEEYNHYSDPKPERGVSLRYLVTEG